jgi:hypothetical protein
VVHPGATHENSAGDNRQRMDQMLRTYEFFEQSIKIKLYTYWKKIHIAIIKVMPQIVAKEKFHKMNKSQICEIYGNKFMLVYTH